MKNRNNPSPIVLVFAFIAIYFIWGTSYLAIIYALKGLKPFTISAFRYLAAGLLLIIWIWIQKASWPSGNDRKVLVISGILMLSGGSGLVVVGEQYISSGAAAIIVATEPLFFVLFDRYRWNLYFSSKRIIAGLFLGFAGIVLFTYFTPDRTAGLHARPVLGTIITLLSAVSWVAGALYANHRLTSGARNLSNSAIQLIAAGLFSGIIAGVKGEFSTLFEVAIPISAWLGLTYLIIMGSLIAYLSFNWLITVQPPAVVSTHTYVNPIIAIFMGWLLAAESLSRIQLIALGFVMAGVVLTQLNKQKIAS
ncbi:EamA family transporter [Mucilaginibacter jinjuensis]|uniref:EamA family transporter n=1 Tax=Mucilaginibacter jinjuensis TaxID=1176721 RepID=A0ABY7TCV4_9SPHI|nr:EamA family transporter [Mucilaginibacter jinjuensis]WCT13452.1 EamA family transporter [Mucilaginibacter jinjuensis]